MNEIYKYPPISKVLPEFIFPKYNSIQVGKSKLYIFEDKTQPLINLTLIYKSGASEYSTAGLAYFSSQMLTRGTKQLTAPQIAELTDSLGANFSVNTNSDDITISFLSLYDYLPRAIDITSDCLSNSVFDNDEISRLQKKQLSSIEQENADSNYLCDIAFNAALHSNSNYQYPIIGTLDSINELTRDDCYEWYLSLISDHSPSFILTGCLDTNEAIDLIQNHSVLNRIINGAIPVKESFRPNSDYFNLQNKGNEIVQFNSASKIAIIDKPDAAQTTLKIGKMTISRKHPDYPLLQLVNVILGGYFHSRLNLLLREKYGYTYGIHSSLDNKLPFSVLSVFSNINTESTRRSVEIILEEMEKLQQFPVTLEELERARQYMLGSFLRSYESIQGVSQLIRVIELFDLPEDYFTEFFNTIKNANVEDLYLVQQKYFSTDNLTISAAGNENYLKEALEPFGLIKIYDKNGKIIV